MLMRLLDHQEGPSLGLVCNPLKLAVAALCADEGVAGGQQLQLCPNPAKAVMAAGQ